MDSLSKAEHAVLRAFANKEPRETKKLSTDGKTLHGNWMGGGNIAKHDEDGKVHIRQVTSRSEQTVVRALRKKHINPVDIAEETDPITEASAAAMGRTAEHDWVQSAEKRSAEKSALMKKAEAEKDNVRDRMVSTMRAHQFAHHAKQLVLHTAAIKKVEPGSVAHQILQTKIDYHKTQLGGLKEHVEADIVALVMESLESHQITL